MSQRALLRLSAVFVALFPLVPGMARAQAHADHEGMHSLPAAEVARQYRFSLTSEPEMPLAGQEALLVLTIADAAGRPVSDLETNHERLLHILVIGRNLEDFQHLHPEDQGTLTPEAVRQGRYPVKVTFARGGTHRLTVDLAHGGHTMAVSFAVEVSGPSQRRTRWDRSTKRVSGDVEVTMNISDRPVRPRRPVTLTFTVRSGGTPVDDLEAWLGAPAHLALYSEWAATAEHLHGEVAGGGRAHGHGAHGPSSMSAEDPPTEMPAARLFGPSVTVTHTFPGEGWHRIFVQFQRQGAVHTVPFDLEVEADNSGY